MNGSASDIVSSSLGSENGQPETAQEPVSKPDDQQILEQFEEYIVSILRNSFLYRFSNCEFTCSHNKNMLSKAAIYYSSRQL